MGKLQRFDDIRPGIEIWYGMIGDRVSICISSPDQTANYWILDPSMATTALGITDLDLSTTVNGAVPIGDSIAEDAIRAFVTVCRAVLDEQDRRRQVCG